MNIQAELSLYPLRKKHIGEVIVRFTEELRTGGLKPETGAMSTVVQGECRKVFAAVQQAFEACGREAGIVLVLKAGNACSDCVPHIEKRSNRRRRHSL